MLPGQASQTLLIASTMHARHELLGAPVILNDPVVRKVLAGGHEGAESSSARLLIEPATGVTGRCARAASGHAAAAPSTVMDSRRSFDHLVGELLELIGHIET